MTMPSEAEIEAAVKAMNGGLPEWIAEGMPDDISGIVIAALEAAEKVRNEDRQVASQTRRKVDAILARDGCLFIERGGVYRERQADGTWLNLNKQLRGAEILLVHSSTRENLDNLRSIQNRMAKARKLAGRWAEPT